MSTNIEFKSINIDNLEVKAEGDDLYKVKGYAAVWGNSDSKGDIIEKGAFTKTIQERGHRIPLLRQHDKNQLVGKVTELKEDDKGLYFEGYISNTERGIETVQLIKDGVLEEVSIGYATIRFQRTSNNGRILKELKLGEISLVVVAVNPLAKLDFKAEGDIDEINERFDQLAKSVAKNMPDELALATETEVLQFKSLFNQATQPTEVTEPEKTDDERKIELLTELKKEFIK